MFIAMNNFKVVKGQESVFEDGWRTRESYLTDVPGFLAFHLLKGDDEGEYISHTMWESRQAFLNWASSDAFRRAHAGGMGEGVIEGHPRAKFYDAVVEERAPAASA